MQVRSANGDKLIFPSAFRWSLEKALKSTQAAVFESLSFAYLGRDALLKIPVANRSRGDTFRAPYAKTDCETQNQEGGRETI